MDRISNLPDEVICHIVSFLSAKDAVFTSVLSTKWRNLFTIIPELQFDDVPRFGGHKTPQGSFADFMDRVLALPSSTRVKKFYLRRQKHRIDPAQYAHLNRSLCSVLKRGVLEIELDIGIGKQYSLPFELFTCKTVVKVVLGDSFGRGNFVVDVLPENAFLPAVETLVLDGIRFMDLRGCAFEKLLSACHVLKELIMKEMEWEVWRWSGKLSSPTLQRLTIHHGNFHQFDATRIILDTPSLTYLKYSDVVPDEYPIVNLDSLVEAKLDLMLAEDHYYDGYVRDNDNITSNPTNLIMGLRNVKIMEISSQDTWQAFYYFREAIPVFENLYHLTINTEDVQPCMKFLPYLLEKSPSLETLVIDGPLHYDIYKPESACQCLSGYSFLLSCHLIKVLQITDYRGTIGEVAQLKHFIEKLSCLELVKLHRSKKPWDDEKEKLMIPTASSKCKINVTFPPSCGQTPSFSLISGSCSFYLLSDSSLP